MPCIECSNGRWKWGQRGRCQYTSKSHCEQAAAAIYAAKKSDVMNRLLDIGRLELSKRFNRWGFDRLPEEDQLVLLDIVTDISNSNVYRVDVGSRKDKLKENA